MRLCKVIPAEGVRILDPKTREPVPPEGGTYEHSSYWVTQARTGDASVEDIPNDSEAPKKTPKNETPKRDSKG